MTTNALPTRAAILTLGLLGIGAAFWLWTPRDRAPLGKKTKEPTETSLAAYSAPPPRAAETPLPSAQPSAHPHVDRRRADELRASLLALIADAGAFMADEEKTGPVDAGVREMPSPVEGNNSKSALGEYIQQRVRDDFFPMAKECYAAALETHPTMAGKAILKFKIVGDTKIGGVVEEATIDKKSTLRDSAFSLCLTESMMGVTFDAPPGPKRELTVEYPIDFSPGEPDSGT